MHQLLQELSQDDAEDLHNVGTSFSPMEILGKLMKCDVLTPWGFYVYFH